jgi:hypothetical protein
VFFLNEPQNGAVMTILGFFDFFSTKAQFTDIFFNFADLKQCVAIGQIHPCCKQSFYRFDFQIIVIRIVHVKYCRYEK